MKAVTWRLFHEGVTIPREGFDEGEHREEDRDCLEAPREEGHHGGGAAAHAPLERQLDKTVDHVLVCRQCKGLAQGWCVV